LPIRRRFSIRPRSVLGRWDTLGEHSPAKKLRPEQLFVLSFIALIGAGTLGLKLIPGMTTAGHIGWIDALFLVTSAVCVTGLATIDISTQFTWLGQAWILVCIQLGGLGIVVLSSFVILALGGRLSLRADTSIGSTEIAPKLNRRKLVRDIVIFTLSIEAVGFAILLALFAQDFPLAESAWHAAFHSVSAFCNAGFSTLPGNLIGYAESPLLLLTIGSLVVLGGIGFIVLEEAYRRLKPVHGRRYRISLHTKLVVVTTALLLTLGALVYGVLEWDNSATLGSMSITDRVSNAWFMSITPRTAGFNSIDYARCTSATDIWTIVLMSIGGSPGSTAGGIKTTALAILLLLAWSRYRRQPIVSIWSRTIPIETTQRAVGLAFFAITTMTFFTLCLALAEGPRGADRDVLPYIFEIVSAFNTVGLSMGVTPDLSEAGKIITTLAMFLGRVGPLTFVAAIALADTPQDRRFRFAKEDVVIA
jgi:trk system potassium uptake protein TrkH